MKRIKNVGMNCSIDGCTKSARSRGMCQYHYQRSRSVHNVLQLPDKQKEQPQPDENGLAQLVSCEYRDGKLLFTFAVPMDKFGFFDVTRRNLNEKIKEAR